MREPADLERDLVCAVEALDQAVEFLTRYDRAQVPSATDGRCSQVAGCTREGLAAARRVLCELSGATARTAARPPARRRPHDYGHGDPGE
jgi:hypothetical protein